MTPRVLFLSHLATRSGAPIILLRFLHWLKANRDWEFSIILNSGGELEPEFAKLGPTLVMDRILGADHRKIRAVLHRHVPGCAAWLDGWTLRNGLNGTGKPCLIYANSIGNAEVLDLLPWTDVPVLCHVHELEFALRRQIGLDYFARVKKRATKYIAVSDAVRQNLIEHHQIPPEEVELIYGFVPTAETPDRTACRLRLIAELGLPADAVIVGASGTIGWMKGTDLFVQLARIMQQRHPELPIYFVWIGGAEQSIFRGQMQHDIRKGNLDGRVFLCGSKLNPLEYFAAFDVFTLTSREDSFPLVGLEAAAVGTPIICFNRSGGMPEFIAQDCGLMVDYLDIDAMATALLQLIRSPAQRKELAGHARQKVREHHDVSVIGPQLADCMKRTMQIQPLQTE